MPSFLSNARAEASRRNGAKSRGPKTPEGKARSAQNALKHGLCADNYLVSAEEEQDYEALEAALVGELAPQGVLQALLVTRIVRATWRLERADRIEAELLAFRMRGEDDLGLALTRDCNSARAFDTLQRYRGGAQAELFRALRTLKALQAEARATEATSSAQPDKPEIRGNRGESDPRRPAENGSAGEAALAPPARSCHPSPGRRTPGRALPNEAEARGNAGLAPSPDEPGQRAA
jgi:hypothetical protein